MKIKRQLIVFGALLLVNVLLAFITYMWMPFEQLSPTTGMPPELVDVPRWQLALANSAIILVVYGLLGLVGFWFTRRVGLPGVFREEAGWRNWFTLPLVFGVVVGVVMVIADRFFASLGDWGGFSHPPFPLSIIASATAGIGEEIVFRMFVMGLWAFLLNLILRRWNATTMALWIANLIAALAFAAGHLPAAMLLTGVATPAGLPPPVLIELFLLNGLVGLVAGERYVRDGLVAAAGVHFWADVVWHVLWPLVGA